MLVVGKLSTKLRQGNDGAATGRGHHLRTYFIISLIVFIGLTIYGLWNGLLF